MTIDLDTLISTAREREAARQAEREKAAIEEWNRQVAEWRETFRRHARDAFGADFMQQLAPKLKTGRQRRYEIRGVVVYRGKEFELTCDEYWAWRRVDDDTQAEHNAGPIVLLRDFAMRLPLEERQDMLLLALSELADTPPLSFEDDGASVGQEETEEDNYQYLKNGLIEHLTRAGIIDGSEIETYDWWPDGLLSAVYRLREQRDALYSAGERYYNLLRGQSPTCDEAMEKALAAVHYPDTIS